MPLDRSHGLRVRTGGTTYTNHGYTLASDAGSHGLAVVRSNGSVMYFKSSTSSGYHVKFKSEGTTRYVVRSSAKITVNYTITRSGTGANVVYTLSVTSVSSDLGITSATTIELSGGTLTDSDTYPANRTSSKSFSNLYVTFRYGSTGGTIKVTNGSTTQTESISGTTSTGTFSKTFTFN